MPRLYKAGFYHILNFSIVLALHKILRFTEKISIFVGEIAVVGRFTIGESVAMD
jgi:predicted ATPase